MGRLGVGFAALALAALVAGSAGGARSSTMTVKIPLPPTNTAKFVLLSVKSAGPIHVSAANAKQLGSPALNSQVIVAWRSKVKGMYDVVVVIHRFRGFVRHLATENLVDLVIAGPIAYVKDINTALPCSRLVSYGYLDDAAFAKNGWQTPENIVPSNDTNAEEQMDGAGYAKCPSVAEPDDPGSK